MTGFDDPRGNDSEDLAFQAEQAARAGKNELALELFAQAAEIETAVAKDVPSTDNRVRGVLAVSAVALWYKAKRYDEAQQVACEFLATPMAIDGPSNKELQALLERCWRDREAAQLAGAKDAFEPLEIKLAGGQVKTGVAPVAEVRERQTLISSLLIRVAEWQAKKPFRVRGEASRDISGSIRIYEAPARAASYGLRLYVMAEPQSQLPAMAELTPKTVVEAFLDIAAVAQKGDQALADLIPEHQYRTAFLSGLRDLAPDGTKVESVTFEHPVWNASRLPTVYELRHREEMTQRLAPSTNEGGARSVEGVLKVVNLRAKAPLIEIVASGATANEITTKIHIDVERFEESVREKLNKFVRVACEERPRRRGSGVELHALDISLPTDAEESPWEYAARLAVEHALTVAEWDEEESRVYLVMGNARGETSSFGVEDLEELRSALEDIATTAWKQTVPWDGGAPVFELEADWIFDVERIVEDALVANETKLSALGWK